MRRFAVLGIAALAVAGSGPVAMPHPAPNVRTPPAGNAACEGCHTAIAAEWRTSLHSTSFTDRDFQKPFAADPDPFCKGCHAPESDPKIGVACVTCHVTNADVLAGPGTATAPHALTRTPAFATEAACARCHEFDFPDSRLRQKPLAMQRTLSEHRGRTDTCATCHMTKTGGHADHRFAAARDEAFVKSAVSIRATRTSPSAIEVVLAPAAVGHAFPTGDLFRRVRVTVGARQRFLARHYANRQELPGVVVRSEVADDRVLGQDRVVVLEAPAEKVRVRVVYERAEGPSEVATSFTTVAGAITLFDEER